MDYQVLENDICLKIKNFNLEDTLDCGQAFRWEKNDKEVFRGVVENKYLEIFQSGDNIIFKNTTEKDFLNFWKDYFDLDTDYEKIKKIITKDSIIKKACTYAGGIKILRQYPWEMICSFIISQNNNIPRIKGIITRLCEAFGTEIKPNIYSFPTAEKIASLKLEDLDFLRAGFRAKYILDAAQKVASNQVDIKAIYNMDIEKAREMLKTIKGIGPKVAECILLFGFYRIEAFPIDVWIKRSLEYFYKDGFPEFSKPYGGIAQQYIFHYIRTCKDAIPEEYRKK